MLYIVLLLVLVALGLLVPALTADQTFWAWLSVGASGAAAVVLVLDWWLRRRSGAPAAGTGTVDHQGSAGDQQAVPEGVVATPSSPGQVDVEPDEEDTDAADSLVVSDLTDEVRVLDERPRYHLVECTWLASRPTLALPVDEARQLGFTPCAVCRPDSGLAARKRAAGQSEPA
ncbi:hypothetical protein ALI22I_19260 [Saccharothrix sp. ALI-22-I]|uniref:hypothetical protein n=1 Tax=Saccharothrix sp. ALI-22-I TaxID=1933778 RepID=UPI00097C1473|nr:hypothetical protein [Saccharothrix sp. ALI-22-I]ONI88492.1 hypothetical protein ALI22I_19260 [Saccharothrix sp. ALI-22-I]